MVDQSWVGTEFEPTVVDITAHQLRFFAKVTGETRDEYANPDPDAVLLAPPTFLFSVGMADPDFFEIRKLGINLGKILHATQSFEYGEPIRSGDRITLRRKLADRFEKKGGALEFLVLECEGFNQRGESVGRMTSTIVERH